VSGRCNLYSAHCPLLYRFQHCTNWSCALLALHFMTAVHGRAVVTAMPVADFGRRLKVNDPPLHTCSLLTML
jgi:hypothetical protein